MCTDKDVVRHYILKFKWEHWLYIENVNDFVKINFADWFSKKFLVSWFHTLIGKLNFYKYIKPNCALHLLWFGSW